MARAVGLPKRSVGIPSPCPTAWSPASSSWLSPSAGDGSWSPGSSSARVRQGRANAVQCEAGCSRCGWSRRSAAGCYPWARYARLLDSSEPMAPPQ
eukprot:6533649-Prymnesium_polylepis.2